MGINIFSGLLWDLWSHGIVEIGNRNYDTRKDTSFCISGEDEKGSGRDTMKKGFTAWFVNGY